MIDFGKEAETLVRSIHATWDPVHQVCMTMRFDVVQKALKKTYELALDDARKARARGLNPGIEKHDPYRNGYESGIAAKEEAIAKLKEQS